MPQLPSEKVFRVFEICAAHQSFTKAADILGTTQSAVSQQIKLLEHAVRLTLFHRQGRRVVLSPEGHALLDAQAKAFDTIHQAVRNARAQKSGLQVSVQVLPGFCVRWLLPRLADFEGQHPEVEVNLLGPDGHGMSPHADLSIDYVTHDKEHWLAEEELFPVVSPAFFDGHQLHGLTGGDLQQKLRTLPLLADASVVGNDTWHEWAKFQAISIATANLRRFPQANMSLALAEYGRGIAMGRTCLVKNALADGTLMELEGFRSPASAGYVIHHSRNRPANAGCERFEAWIKKAIKLD